MTARPVLFDRETRDRNAHVAAGREQSAEDHAKQLSDLRAWLSTFERGEPCPACSWPFPEFHLCASGAS